MSRKVLVTGADGFIGSHLVEALLQQGYRVRALTQYNSFNYWGWLEDISDDNLEIVSGDVRDPAFCRKIVEDMDTVFHLAALIAIPYSYVAPQSYVDTNVTGTLNICQASLDCGVERVVHTSTSEVYGTARYVPIDEDHPLQPQSPYSASKIAADSIAYSFYSSFNLPITIARPFNTYGPRQSARAVIPTIISQIANNHDKLALGDLSPTRDFNYVTDTCRAFIGLASCKDAIGEVVNIGTNYEISIKDVVKLVMELMGREVEIVEEAARVRPEKSEVFRLWCDNSKIVDLIGYKPEVDIKQGIENCIEWFLNPENLRKYKTGIYNL